MFTNNLYKPLFYYMQVGFEGFLITLRERLRTYKVFTKDQCFCLNYHNIFIKSYVVDVY